MQRPGPTCRRVVKKWLVRLPCLCPGRVCLLIPYLYGMSPSNVSYLTFGIVLLLAVIFDLGLLSKKGATVSIRRALYQTAFWVLLAMAFFAFLWYQNGHKTALEYL